MRITYKMLLVFSLVAMLLAFLGYISFKTSENAMKESIGQSVVSLAEIIMENINANIAAKLQEFRLYSKSPMVIESLKASNEEFGKLEDVQGYIGQKDREWISARKDEITPFMQSRMNNSVAADMKRRTDFFEKEYGYRVYGEVFITNKYGANIAQTGRTSDYRQDDEEWWRAARKSEVYLSEVNYDESLDAYSLDIGMRIDDSDGNFLGVMKIVLNIEDIINAIESFSPAGTGKENATSFLLLTKDGKLIYSSEHYEFLEDKSDFLSHHVSDVSGKESRRYFVCEGDEPGEGEELFAHAHSKGIKNIADPGWILIVERRTEELFAPVFRLRKFEIIATIALVVSVLGVGFIFSRMVAKPIMELQKGTAVIAGGNLDFKTDIATKDEIGELAKSFDTMVSELKRSRLALERHQEELEGQVEDRTRQLHRKIEEAELSKRATMNILEDMEEANRKLIESQEKLKGHVGELKKLDAQKDQFISIAAHELKTPLTSIKGFSDLLMKKEISENAELRGKYLGVIFKDTKRLSELITNILELSRMDIGTLKIAWQSIKIDELINEVREQMDIIIRNKGIDSEYNVEEGLLAIALDRDKIIQVLSNIINNAVHYTEKGKISVGVNRQGEDVLFSVADTGIGIPEEHIGKMFQRFYQVDNPLTRKIGGSGLGLSLCKGFVEAMGGRIWVESKVGKGSVFYFTIPLNRGDAKNEEISIFKEAEAAKSPYMPEPGEKIESGMPIPDTAVKNSRL